MQRPGTPLCDDEQPGAARHGRPRPPSQATAAANTPCLRRSAASAGRMGRRPSPHSESFPPGRGPTHPTRSPSYSTVCMYVRLALPAFVASFARLRHAWHWQPACARVLRLLPRQTIPIHSHSHAHAPLHARMHGHLTHRQCNEIQMQDRLAADKGRGRGHMDPEPALSALPADHLSTSLPFPISICKVLPDWGPPPPV